MPYLPLVQRGPLDRPPVHAVAPANAAELTYVLCRIAWNYWTRSDGRFQQIADVRAALESTLHEFNRQIADPYEDLAILRNGDL